MILTCSSLGGIILNHHKVEEFKKENKKLKEILIKDNENNKIRKIKGKYFINSTSFLEMDKIRNLSKNKKYENLKEERRIKFLLPFQFSIYNSILKLNENIKNEDILIIPFERNTIISLNNNFDKREELGGKNEIGIESKSESSFSNIKPNEKEIKYFLNLIKNQYNLPIERIDILSCWFEINKKLNDSSSSNQEIIKDENDLYNGK